MLERSALTWLPPERRIPELAEDQKWLKARAQGYGDVDSLLVPPKAVSVFESALFKLYKAGIYRDPVQIPFLHEGRFEGPWVSGVRIASDLIIEDGEGGFASIAVTIEYRNQINEIVLRERIEAIENSPYIPVLNFQSGIFDSSDDYPELIIEDCAQGIGRIKEVLDSGSNHLGIPGEHSGPRFLTVERQLGFGTPWMHAEALNLSAARRERRMQFHLEGGPVNPIYADHYGRYQTHVPDQRLLSPSIALPTEKAWAAAVAITSGTRAESDFIDLDEWLESVDWEGYDDINEASEVQDTVPELFLLGLLTEPEFPMIVIADPSPFYGISWHEDPYQEIKDCFDDTAQILRITWPMQLFIQAATDGDLFTPPGSVRLCFPNAYRELGVANILVTPDELFRAASWDGSLDDEELRTKWWRERFEEPLITAFVPCTELHPDYLRLRRESSRLQELRRQIELEAIDATRNRIQEAHDLMIARWDNLDSAEKRYKALKPQYDELYENWGQALDENKDLKYKLSKAIQSQDSVTSVANSGQTSSLSASSKGFLAVRPIWSFAKLDLDGPWSFENVNSSDMADLLRKLGSFEGMTFEQLGASGSHFIRVDGLIKEARDRLLELNQENTERLYSIRLAGVKRAWGIPRQNVIQLLWWDPKHEVCPSPKKHT